MGKRPLTAGREAAELAPDLVASRVRQPRHAIASDRAAPDGDAHGARPGATAALYLRLHTHRVIAGVHAHLLAAPWPPPHPRITWTADAFIDAAITSIASQLGAPAFDPRRVLEIVYPANPWPAVDACRPIYGTDPASAAAHAGDPLWDGPLGSRDWSSGAAAALAMQIEASLRESVVRLAPRYVAAFDQGRTVAPAGWQVAPPSPTDLLTSHPMDRAVARALTTPGVVCVIAGHGNASRLARGENQSPAVLRPVRVEWQGKRDPALWNWLKVVEPADATGEEVAETLWGDGHGESASFHAYGLTRAAPYYGVPPAWARQLPEPRAAEPRGSTGAIDDGQHRVIALSRSIVSDELALIQSSRGSAAPSIPGERAPEAAELLALLDTSAVVIEYLTTALAAWRGSSAMEAAAAFLERRRLELATAVPEQVTRWAPVVRTHHDNLRAVANAVASLSQQLGAAGAADPGAADAGPVRDVFVTYARAAASAHLTETCRALIATAERQQAMLVAHVVLARVRTAGAAVAGLEATSTSLAVDESDRQAALEAQAAAIHSQLLLGQAPSADDVDETTLAADELTLRAQLRTLSLRLGDLSRLARLASTSLTAHLTGTVTGSDALGLDEGAALLGMRLALVEDALYSTNQTERAGTDPRMPDDERRAMRRRQRRAALNEAQQRYAAIGQETNIAAFLSNGHEAVEDLQKRTRIAELLGAIALLIGVSVASSGIGNAVTAGVRGFLFARRVQGATELASLSRALLVTTRAGGLYVESTLNAGAQSLVFDAKFGEAFGEDLLANLAGSVALRPFQQILADLGPLEHSALTKWQRLRGGQVVLAKGAVMTAEGITSAAVGYVAHRLVSERPADPATLESWLLQGMSIGVGRFVHAQLGEHVHRFEHMAGLKAFQRELGLDKMHQAVTAQARAAMATGDPSAALGCLVARRNLLLDEQRMLYELLSRPDVLASSGLGRSEAEAMRTDVEQSLDRAPTASAALLPLRLAGLTEVVTGTAFTGTPDQVRYALREGRRAGLIFIEREPGRRWSVDLGGRVVSVVVVGYGVGGTFSHVPRIALAGDDPNMLAGVENLPPKYGYLDVAVHGNPNHFVVWRLKDGKPEKAILDHRDLARYIAASGFAYRGIRLVSCSSGARDLAQHLANKLRVTVLAPNRDVGINADGSHDIGRTPEERADGRWISFEPRDDLRPPVRRRDDSPPERRIDRFHRERAAAARGEIAELPIRRMVVQGHHEYVIASHLAARLAELIAFLPGMSVQIFPRGLLVRGARGEWYFTHESSALAHELAAPPAGTTEHGSPDGLPPPNAWTVQLWGFRGVRNIGGQDRTAWTAQDAQDVHELTQAHPLLYAGHVGVSIDGGQTIYGFTPQPPPGAGTDELVALLKAHVTMPGWVQDDTRVFALAREMAERKGWNTAPVPVVLRLDPEPQRRIIETILRLEDAQGNTALGYAFPLPTAENGSHFRDSAAFSRDCTANCAVWPRMLGLPIPESTGNLERYIPALRAWSDADHPIEARALDDHTGDTE